MSVPSRPNIYPQPLTELSQITFWWDPPTSTGGSPITSYILSNTSPPLTYTYNENQRSAFITNLTPSTTYAFQIAASNANGISPFAPFATVKTGIEPLPITDLSANPDSNVSNSLISWSSNVSNTDVQYQVLTAIPTDLYGNEIPTSTITKSVFSNKTSFFLQNLGNYNYNISLQTGNSVGYSEPVYTGVTNLFPGSSLFTVNAGPPASASSWSIATTPTISVGTSPFTIEWFQNMTSTATSSRTSFCLYTSSDKYVQFDISGQSAYDYTYTIDYSTSTGTTLNTVRVVEDLQNRWVHFALVATGTRFRLFVDGAYIMTSTANYDLTGNTSTLMVGFTPRVLSSDTSKAFRGYITNFRMVTGTQLYTDISGQINIPPIPVPISNTGSTEVIVIPLSTRVYDPSSNNRTITQTNTTFSTSSPDDVSRTIFYSTAVTTSFNSSFYGKQYTVSQAGTISRCKVLCTPYFGCLAIYFIHNGISRQASWVCPQGGYHWYAGILGTPITVAPGDTIQIHQSALAAFRNYTCGIDSTGAAATVIELVLT